MLSGSKAKTYKLEDLLNILSTGFLKGGSGFLKAAQRRGNDQRHGLHQQRNQSRRYTCKCTEK